MTVASIQTFFLLGGAKFYPSQGEGQSFGPKLEARQQVLEFLGRGNELPPHQLYIGVLGDRGKLPPVGSRAKPREI